MSYKPPYQITPKIINLISSISEALGRFSALSEINELKLRRINRIKTIQGSLAIEGNTLSEDQVQTILEGKTVVAPPREVQEVRNAIKAYDAYSGWNPYKQEDLLKAHELLMTGLLDNPGLYRKKGVGVMGKEKVIHVAPPAENIPFLMKDLLHWLKTGEEHPLLTSCVFHYEFEFIHPFEDGNGRLGRLWQNLILSKWNKLFIDIPVESMVYRRQKEYYQAITDSSAVGECTVFIEFMLDTIYQEIIETTPKTTPNTTPKDVQREILSIMQQEPAITRKELAERLGLSIDGVKYHIKELNKQGKIKYTGSSKKGHWEILNG